MARSEACATQMRSAAAKTPAPAPSPEDALEAQKRAFLRMVSHELRTPLNSILGFSGILAEELYGPLGAPQYKEYAQIIRGSGEKLLTLVNQLVDIARLQSGALEVDLQPQPLQPVLDAVLDSFTAELDAGAVTAKISSPGKLPSVLADERGLHAVLSGLIHNAIVFSPAGGQVRITAAERDGSVEIAIQNPGARIAAEDLVRLKQPFEQGEEALTRRHHGAGLGLPICALTAKAMGGRLDLTARPAGGLAVRVTLPAA